MFVETRPYPVPLRAREEAAKAMLGSIAARRESEIAAYREKGGEVRLMTEGVSGVRLIVAGGGHSPEPRRHDRHSLALLGMGPETAIITSGGALINPREERIGGGIIFGEFKGEKIVEQDQQPVRKGFLSEGEPLILLPGTPYKIDPINGGTSAVLAFKFLR